MKNKNEGKTGPMGLKITKTPFHIFVYFLLASFSFSLLTPPRISALPEMTKKEKKTLVRSAVKKFKAGAESESKELFLKASSAWPENSAVNYYLGIIYLKEGDKKRAVKEWREYVKKDPGSKNSLKLRKHITLLQKEIAHEYAKEAVLNENSPGFSDAESDAVAVSYFDNLGSDEFNPIKKGLAAMLITDISKVPGIKVVERMNMEALLNEMRLSDAGFMAKGKSVKMGKLLRAKRVVNGNFADISGSELQVASFVMGTTDGKEHGSDSASGKLSEFYDVEKVIAFGILKNLGYSESEIPSSVKEIHTKNYEAFKAFSVGLDHFDKEEYDKAREKFQEALDLDPEFKMARRMLLLTPLSFLSVSAIAATTSVAGPSSIVAAGGFAMATKAMIAGGIVVGGAGAAALAGGLGGGGGEDNNAETLNSGSGGEIDTTPTKVCTPSPVSSPVNPQDVLAPVTRSFELAKSSGSFSFSLDAGEIPDQFEVMYEGKTLHTKTCASGTGGTIIEYAGSSTQVSVIVRPHCDIIEGSQQGPFAASTWTYTVGCP